MGAATIDGAATKVEAGGASTDGDAMVVAAVAAGIYKEAGGDATMEVIVGAA